MGLYQKGCYSGERGVLRKHIREQESLQQKKNGTRSSPNAVNKPMSEAIVPERPLSCKVKKAVVALRKGHGRRRWDVGTCRNNKLCIANYETYSAELNDKSRRESHQSSFRYYPEIGILWKRNGHDEHKSLRQQRGIALNTYSMKTANQSP